MNLRELLREQSGVIARRQVLALGMTDNDIERLVRRRIWARVWNGVYVHHTGPLTETQRDWAAVLAHPTAALAGRSTLRRAGIATGSDHHRRTPHDVELIVPHNATTRAIAGVRTRRCRDFQQLVHPSRTPPTMRIEEAALDVAQCGTEIEAIAVLSDACRSRQTTADRLRSVANQRPRLRNRKFLMAVLADAAEGTHSVLESRYLRDVERTHALPRASRQDQARTVGQSIYRDVAYKAQGVVVELDGRFGHDLAIDRWADIDRDVSAVEDGLITLRFGYGQVLTPCRCAATVARVLTARGWTGSPQVCGTNCGLGN